jgi:membrane protein
VGQGSTTDTKSRDGASPTRPFERRLDFASAVMRRFVRHRGLMLAGAIAYYLLLSMLPLSILVFVGLSQFVGPDEVVRILAVQLELVLAGGAEPILETVRAAFEARAAIGGVGVVVIVFVSGAVFRVLEEAMRIVFDVEHVERRRQRWLAVLKPIALISVVLFGLLILTLGASVVQAISSPAFDSGETSADKARVLLWLLYMASFIGQVLLFAAVYKILPPVKIPVQLALFGGLIAALAWEACRALLTWYFEVLSLVNVVYGSLATAVVLLFGFELVAIILLVGAEVIAEASAREAEGRGLAIR